ncbi:MAG: S9 family peptidase [Pseudomonadota bacterium]
MVMRFLTLALGLMLATPLAAQSGERFSGADLFALEYAADPRISPDGRQVAYVRMSGDIMVDRFMPSIWLVDTASGDQRPLIAGPGAHSSPRWSPDGSKLAYLSTAEDGGAQLFVRWMENGATVRVTNLPNTPSSIAWSPNGEQIAYTMLVPGSPETLGEAPARPEGADWAEPLTEQTRLIYRTDGAGYLQPGFSHVFVVPAEGGAPRQISSGDFHHDGALSWTADGLHIVTAANRQEDWEIDRQESEIYALAVNGGALSQLTDRNGPDYAPAVSPDGGRIAYLGYDDRMLGYHNAELHVMNRDGSNRRSLTGSLDRSIDSFAWSNNSRSLYVAYDDRGATTIARVTLDGTINVIAEGLGGATMDRPYSGGSFSIADNDLIVATDEEPTRPADLVLVRRGDVRRITDLNSDIIDHRRMGQVRRIEVPSSHDGRQIEAWLTLPPDYVEGQSYPMIMEIHGGPYAAYGPHFATDNQLYAAGGYIVVSANPRGSTSYGAEFANLIENAYPGNDYDDLMSVVDRLIADGMVDPDGLFVTGGSGGGILTAWIVGQTNRFRAAATQKPVINWTSLTLNSDLPAFVNRYWFSADPWDDPMAYWSRSPLSLMNNVQTPTLVLVGETDYRTPVSEAAQYFSALRLEGVPSAFIVVPGASHGGYAGRPSQSAARVSAILEWFDRYRENPWVPPAD